MSFHHGRFLVHRSFFLRFPQFLHQGQRFHFQSSGETATSASMNNLHKLLAGEVEELIQIHSTEHELTESSLLLQLHLCSGVS